MLYLYRGKIHSQMGLYACIGDEQFKLNESLPKVNIQSLAKKRKILVL